MKMPEPEPAIEIDIRIEAAGWRASAPSSEGTVDAAVRAALGTAGLAGGLTGGLFELSVLLTDDTAIAALNEQWRGKSGSTNVLSFPGDSDAGEDGVPVLLGDIVIAFETLTAEADAAGISTDDHLRHLVVHGVLHLLGYDHETDKDAELMERCEIEILGTLGVPNPYAAADRRLEHAPR
jgi:probable rRNA maturation factor